MIECGGDCASFTPSPSAQWFKIYHDGPTAATKLIKAGNSLTVTVPASLKAGDYLMRHEIIVSRPRSRIATIHADCRGLISDYRRTSPVLQRNTTQNARSSRLLALEQQFQALLSDLPLQVLTRRTCLN